MFYGELKVGMCCVFLFFNEQHCDGLYLFKAHFFLGSQHGMLLKPHIGFLNGERDDNVIQTFLWLSPFVQSCSIYSPNAVLNYFTIICFLLHNFIKILSHWVL